MLTMLLFSQQSLGERSRRRPSACTSAQGDLTISNIHAIFFLPRCVLFCVKKNKSCRIPKEKVLAGKKKFCFMTQPLQSIVRAAPKTLSNTLS
jgi:hypothetical protein